MSLSIQRTSPLHSMQDLGRFGLQDTGATPAGPLDIHAFSWANHVLKNAPNTAMLELIRGGFVAQFNSSVTFILTGADCNATLGERPCPPWMTHRAESGDVLRLGSPIAGQIVYLAIAGGFAVTPRFGSVATSQRDRLGGLDGQGSPLKSGDQFPFLAPLHCSGGIPHRFIPDYTHPLLLRILPSYQFAQFPQHALHILLNERYSVGSQISRMGYRIQGPALPNVPEPGLSEPIAFGAIQVPPDGRPIVLLRDRQSLGGYPKLGVLMREDIGALCQRQPGDSVHWCLGDHTQAVERFMELNSFFSAIV